MNSLTHGSIPFRWHDHLSALRWLGLLYRRPHQFRDDLLTCSVRQQLITAVWLLIHSAPYVFVLSAACYLLRTILDGSEFQIGHLANGIGGGIAFGIAGGIGGGIGVRIAFGIAFGIAVGIAFGISLTRIYYQLIHPPFVWPRLHGRWYPRHVGRVGRSL